MSKKKREYTKKVKAEKKRRTESVKQKRNKWVHWTCKTCKKVIDIMVSPRNLHLYTEKREKEFDCLNCKPIKRKK